jgi:hypothetical protein
MLTIAHAAQVAHQANSALQIATGDPHPSPDWAQAPHDQHDASERGVRTVLDVRAEHPDWTNAQIAEALHTDWMAGKTDAGWVLGPVKDATALTHPAMVAFDQLPQDQIARDELFVAVVSALAPFIT